MVIFNRGGKVNFVDTNDVFVGFDFEQKYCEHFGWTIEKELKLKYTDNLGVVENTPNKLDGYVFDTSYFKDLDLQEDDDCSAVAFKLYNEDGCGKELYLILYNSHNGYYSHGFTAEVGGDVFQAGHL